MAATTTILSPEPVVIPSNWRRNSVLILLTPSCSPDLLSLSNASISSMKMMVGWMCLATLNRALTSFSPSPSHLLVRLLELMLIKLLLASAARARARSVFPLPGGPNINKPLAGSRRPVNSSGLSVGSTTISCRAFLALS